LTGIKEVVSVFTMCNERFFHLRGERKGREIGRCPKAKTNTVGKKVKKGGVSSASPAYGEGPCASIFRGGKRGQGTRERPGIKPGD